MKTPNHFFFAIATLLLLFFTNASAQKNTYIGAAITGEFLDDFNPRIGGGLTFERKLKEHHGFESGIFYRSTINSASLTVTDTLGTTVYSGSAFNRYISFPLYYKHYSDKINFSIGFNFDYFIGTKFNFDNTIVKPFFYYEPYSSWRSGISFKISKSYHLMNNVILEPEFKASLISDGDGAALYGGIGLIAKFDVAKYIKLK